MGSIMKKEIERGSLISPKRSTKHLIQGIIYKVIGKSLAGSHYVIRDPYDGNRRYIHKNNIKVMA